MLKNINRKTAALIILITYFTWLIYVMFFGFSRETGEFYMYNLIPFNTIKNYIYYFSYFGFKNWIINLLGNIVVFTPFGILLPMINNRLQKIHVFLLTFLLLITLLEAAQLFFRVGSFDIDDIILNTVGALIGFGLYWSNRKLIKKISK